MSSTNTRHPRGKALTQAVGAGPGPGDGGIVGRDPHAAVRPAGEHHTDPAKGPNANEHEQLQLFHGDGTRADEWSALFQREDCVVKSLRLRGWVCPACGRVEPNLFVLWQNHGLDPNEPQDGEPTCPVADGGAGR